MEIDETKIFYEGLVDEEKALACLLADGACFLHNVNTSDGKTTGVSVVCSDVFAWGCADAEGILSNDWSESSEIADLYRLWKLNNKWGCIIWVCKKRNEQPQNPVKKSMIKDGVWDEILESLPENKYDAYCKAKWGKKDNQGKNNDN